MAYSSPYLRSLDGNPTLSYELFQAQSGTAVADYEVGLAKRGLYVLPWRRGRPSPAALVAWASLAIHNGIDPLAILRPEGHPALPLGLLGPLVVLAHCDPDYFGTHSIPTEQIIPVVVSATDYAFARESLQAHAAFLRTVAADVVVRPIKSLEATLHSLTQQRERGHERFPQAVAAWLLGLPWLVSHDRAILDTLAKSQCVPDDFNGVHALILRREQGLAPLVCPPEIIMGQPPGDDSLMGRRDCERFNVLPVRHGARHVVLLCGSTDRTRVGDKLLSEGVDEIVFVETNADFIANTLQGSVHVEAVQIDNGSAGETTADEVVIDPAKLSAFRATVAEPDPTLFCDWLLVEGMRRKASDIHLEDFAGRGRARLAIDNSAVELITFQRHILIGLATVIKHRASMNSDGYGPQDRRFTFRYGNRPIDVRVSLLYNSQRRPKFTLRLLDKAVGIKSLPELSLPDGDLIALREQIHKKQGLILLSGPTGAGKSTTLFAAMSERNRVDQVLYSLEDPPEYDVDGVCQLTCTSNPDNVTQSTLLFSDMLAKVLRADPDVIMVGEIRDKSTADVAVTSALTGHLLLSTVHANDSIRVVRRMVDLGVEPSKLVDCLLLSCAQRLVRRLCPQCVQSVPLDSSDLATFAAANVAIGPTQRHLFKPTVGGCPECAHLGYKGRALVLEYLSMDDGIRELITRLIGDKNVQPTTSADLRNYASEHLNYRTLYQKGLALVLNGTTSLEEIKSTCC